ncbi:MULTISPECIES: hypothetical protein [Rhodobacterales]|uniref:hypothetical protein n=1 Tax=Roseobacter sp. N2S TaxID=2663844 RepID=UPI00285715D3|nr:MULTISPECIES: hypothetical protein [Rhodobacterales]MDR6267728.1 hypothetical protein [Roseobacter sp. N2S]
MEFFVGLDVSLDETHICVVDEGGRIIKETRALSEPQAIAKAIRQKRALEVGEQLLQPDDAIFLAYDDVITLSEGLILRANLCLCRNQHCLERIDFIWKISRGSHPCDLSKSGANGPH